MTDRIHGDEPDTSEPPRRPGAAAGVEQEVAVLRHIETSSIRSIVQTPSVRHSGRPHDLFPHHWSILGWLDGVDAWTVRDRLDIDALDSLTEDLAHVVAAIGEVSSIDVRRRSPGSRGGPLGPLLERLDGWLSSPEWNAAVEIIDEPVEEGFVHGDLIPGNLLVDGTKLTAVIDWGGAGWGDTAQDLAPAWSVLTTEQRSAFREAVGADDAAWLRGRTFELEHAVGGVLYYVPKGHPLGDVMARTLDRILSDS